VRLSPILSRRGFVAEDCDVVREQEDAMKSLEEVMQVQAEVQDELLKHPEVTGVDVGRRTIGGEQTGELAIRIYVRDKKEALQRLKLPAELQGVPVEVIERNFKLL
jgi:hypothetical protein